MKPLTTKATEVHEGKTYDKPFVILRVLGGSGFRPACLIIESSTNRELEPQSNFL
jgi:hypothetical protein